MLLDLLVLVYLLANARAAARGIALENRNYYHDIFGVIHAYTYNYEGGLISFQKPTVFFVASCIHVLLEQMVT